MGTLGQAVKRCLCPRRPTLGPGARADRLTPGKILSLYPQALTDVTWLSTVGSPRSKAGAITTVFTEGSRERSKGCFRVCYHKVYIPQSTFYLLKSRARFKNMGQVK